MKDYHAILGIAKNSTIDQIKAAYRKKALQYHPDANPSPNAAKQFNEISDAYRTLIDPNYKPYVPPPPKPKRDIWGQPVQQPAWKDSMAGQYEQDKKQQQYFPSRRHLKPREPEIDLWAQLPKDPMAGYWKEYNRLSVAMAYEEPEKFWEALDEWSVKNLGKKL